MKQTPVGLHGAGKAALLWGGLAALSVLAFLVQGVVGLGAIALIIVTLTVLAFNASTSTAFKISCALLILIFLASIAYFFAAMNASINAADANLPSPAWANFTLLSIITSATSLVSLVLLLVRFNQHKTVPAETFTQKISMN